MPLILLGIVLSFESLAYLGVICFGVSVVFQLITLPVEFDASRRAIESMERANILDSEEIKVAKKILFACALTYVASLFITVMYLLKLIIAAKRKR